MATYYNLYAFTRLGERVIIDQGLPRFDAELRCELIPAPQTAPFLKCVIALAQIATHAGQCDIFGRIATTF